MRQVAFLVALVGAGFSAAHVAHAQVCTQPSPGVARVDTTGITVTINMGTTTIPKVNGVSCGFSASSISVVGVAGKDTVILNYVPPTVPVAMALDAGTNTVTVYATNGDDTVACGASSLDRNGDSTADLDFGSTVVSVVTLYARAGNDVVDCTAAGYKLKVLGGDGDDKIDGGPLNDSLDGGNGDDIIHGNAGNDSLTGGTGNDSVHGDAGNDTFSTKSTFDGNDAYDGGAGTDNVAYSGRTTPVVAGGAGAEDAISDDLETIKGGKADDTLDFSAALVKHNLYGGLGNDTLRGGANDDKLFGEAGNDLLVDGAGKDIISAGDGDDVLDPALDSVVEKVQCEAGIDTYTGNPDDIFIGCEIPDGGAPPPIAHVASGEAHSCAILASGVVKCWGANLHGELGLGDTNYRGDNPGEMGASLPAVNLGTGRTAVSIAAGAFHTCAILDNGSVKCWGYNGLGRLGLGDTNHRGDQPGEMGDALPAVDLGTGRTAIAIAAGCCDTCVILDDRSMKCWGFNSFGTLGLGDGYDRGDQPGEMGDALPAVDLGKGRMAIRIAPGSEHTCVLLDTTRVKCWGRGMALVPTGEAWVGDEPGEMGDDLPSMHPGVGRRIVELTSGTAEHVCAVLDNGTVKCWGRDVAGEVGAGSVGGAQGAPSLDTLPIVPLGGTAVDVALGSQRSCAVFSDGTVKCWGSGIDGGLGQGNINNIGDNPGEVAALVPIALGTGRTVAEVATSDAVCGKLDNATLKCWGSNGSGQLGQGDVSARGDNPGEMGDALPTVNLGGAIGFAPPPEEAASGKDDELAADAGGCSTSRADASLGFVLLALVVALRLRVRPRS